jgi:hypothetical protein
MKKTTMLLGVVVAIVLLLGTSSVANAQALRTWVSGVGDDVNPCSRTAPCKTFAGAISKTAAGGEIDAMDPGGFGAVTITKAMTIDGGPNAGGILSAGTNGVIVNAGVNDVVTLRNLVINGGGTGLNGIRFLAGGSLIVKNVIIQGNTQIGIDFVPSGASQLLVSDTFVQNNVGGGIHIGPGAAGSAKAALVRVITLQNLFGVKADDRSNVTINDSVASQNGANGFVSLSASAATNMFIESSIASNNPSVTAGGIASVGALSTIRISNIDTTNNGNGLFSSGGGQILSFGNNKNAGNTTNGAPTGSAGALQ